MDMQTQDEMIQHEDMPQGSPAWHQHRATHFNASDAPVMLGISPYKTRSQLLHELHTGITQDVDEATQRRFDDGHRFEALARPLAEKIIGQRLFPIVGSVGKLSASFDGLTMDDSVCWEHKSANASLLESLRNNIIPEQYHPQMEQQLMLSGAERCLFSATKWDGDALVEEAHCWYASDPELRSALLQGWAQLAIDLDAYVPPNIVEMPKAEVTIELPALFVHAKGEITEHNMEAFGLALTNKLAEVRAIALLTDQDFSNAKEAAKKFRETAKEITLSEAAMLAQTETIGEASRKMKAWVKDLNATALQLEKDVEREDLAKKQTMILEAKQAYSEYVAALELEIKPIRLALTQPDFAGAIKGKRNYASMQDAIDTALSLDGKAKADAEAKDIRAKLAWYADTNEWEDGDLIRRFGNGRYCGLFRDMQQIITKPMEDFTLTITSRIDKHKADESAKIERIRAEEEVKARAKVEAESKAAQLAEHQEAGEVKAREEALWKATGEAADIEEKRKQSQLESQSKPFSKTQAVPAKLLCPSRDDLISAVADYYEVDHRVAQEWLEAEFQTIKQAA